MGIPEEEPSEWGDYIESDFLCTCGGCQGRTRIARVMLLLRDTTEELFSIGLRLGEGQPSPTSTGKAPELERSEPPKPWSHDDLVARLLGRQSSEAWPLSLYEDDRWRNRAADSGAFAETEEDGHPSHRALSRWAADRAIDFSAPFFADPRRDDLVSLAFILLHFEEFWVTQLDDWRPSAEGDAHASMLRHVFAIYSVSEGRVPIPLRAC